MSYTPLAAKSPLQKVRPPQSCWFHVQSNQQMNQLFVARMVAVVLTATVISTAVNKYIVEPRVSKPKDK